VLLATLVFVPALILLAIGAYVSSSPYTSRLFTKPDMHAVVTQLPQGLWSLFSFTRTSITFWHGFGISQMISLGGNTPTVAVQSILVSTTLIIFWLMIVRELRVLARLAHLARARSLSTALVLAFSDAVLVSYLCFIAIMTVVYTVSHGEIASGRYFLPFILPALLCGVWYVPQMLSPRPRRMVRTAGLAFLVAYAAVEAAFSWGAIERRFYDLPPRNMTFYEDNGKIDAPADTATIERGAPLLVRGWTFDSTTSRQPLAVIAVVDGHRRIPLHAGEMRPDIALLYHDDDIVRCGFSGRLDTTHLYRGTHLLSLIVVERARAVALPPSKDVSFVIH
jgi:hypothetical protein